MLIRYIKAKIKERRRKKGMEKIIAELKKLLEAGSITQEDFDLALSKLQVEDSTPQEVAEEKDQAKEKEIDAPSKEEVPEDEKSEDEEIKEVPSNDEVENKEVPPTEDVSEENPGVQEDVSAPQEGQESDGALQEILKELKDLKGQVEAIQAKVNEVDPTKPIEESNPKITNTHGEEKSVYGPGIRTVYSK